MGKMKSIAWKGYFFLILPVSLLSVLLLLPGCEKPAGRKPCRVIISTDIGGTDFDDYQSMAHLLVYADTFDIEGIISSPYGDGRKEQILEAIDAYEKDYPLLKTHSDRYPLPGSLRRIVKQGAVESPGAAGHTQPTEGSEWIVACARRDDSRPLWILIWGGIEDLAQALHDAPDILPRIRVFFIGGPNKKWSAEAYQYIADNFPDLWIIESNATYRGWFVGGEQSGDLSNKGFVDRHVRGCGALGDYFTSRGPVMKMGDTPSLTHLLGENPEAPWQGGWGGSYVRAWERPHKIFRRLTTATDSIEQFGVLELRLPFNPDGRASPAATLVVDRPLEATIEKDTLRFFFSPKNAGLYEYTLASNIPSLRNAGGAIRSYRPPASAKQMPSPALPNWFTDDPSPEFIEGDHIGVKTLNQHRAAFLHDFARRMARCKTAAQQPVY